MLDMIRTLRSPRVRFAATAVTALSLLLAARAVPGAEVTGVPGEGAAEEEVLSSPSTYESEGQDLSVLSIQSRPEGARVFVDGEDRGTTPLYVRDLSEARHEVILYLPGRGAFRQVVEGRGGRIFVDLEAEEGLGIGFVSVLTDPSDARIDVDGRRVGLSPLELPLGAGRHTIHVSKAGFRDAEATVVVEAETRQDVNVTLQPREGALLVISSPAGAEVFLDGNAVGKAWEPLRIEDVEPGTHEIRLEKEGYNAWKKPGVRVRSGETATVLAALLPQRDYSWVRLYSNPTGARVWLDGKEMGTTGEDGLKFKAAKGAHSLRLEVDPAETPGYEPLRMTANFLDDEIDYAADPLRLPPVSQNFTQARALIERGQLEKALGFLDRVSPEHPSYAEARLMAVEILRELGRVQEIPTELETILGLPEQRNNPVLNLALGYWALEAAREASDAEAVDLLGRALEGLDRASQSVDLFPPDLRQPLILKTHYYAGIASEILFNLTAEKRYLKKGVQAWEIFFARLDAAPRALEAGWVEKARQHRRSMDFLAKKLEG